MSVELGIPLNLDHIRTETPAVILATLKSWLKQANPTCLMHPHGFYVVLLNRTETEEWRFHFWPEGSRSVVGMPGLIHTHYFHVESRVLQGQLTNVLYDIVTVPIGGYPLYEVAYSGDRYSSTTSNVLRRTDRRVQPVVRERNTIERGDVYRVERHSFHEAIVPEQIATATLICMHGRSPGAASVIGLDGYPEEINFKRTEHRAHIFTDKLCP